MTEGPPFTMGRYDSLGACITAEREWLAEENERLSKRLSGALQHLEEAREGLANYAQENERLKAALFTHSCTCGSSDRQIHTHASWCPYRVACSGQPQPGEPK